MKSRVRVSTASLLKVVRDRRAKIVRQHRQDLEKYKLAIPVHQAKVAAALRKAADAAEQGRLPVETYGGIKISVGSAPYKPRLDTGKIDRLIKTLEMASDESISISADDAAQYLG